MQEYHSYVAAKIGCRLANLLVQQSSPGDRGKDSGVMKTILNDDHQFKPVAVDPIIKA